MVRKNSQSAGSARCKHKRSSGTILFLDDTNWLLKYSTQRHFSEYFIMLICNLISYENAAFCCRPQMIQRPVRMTRDVPSVASVNAWRKPRASRALSAQRRTAHLDGWRDTCSENMVRQTFIITRFNCQVESKSYHLHGLVRKALWLTSMGPW